MDKLGIIKICCTLVADLNDRFFSSFKFVHIILIYNLLSTKCLPLDISKSRHSYKLLKPDYQDILNC